MNIWALDKDNSIKHFLLLLSHEVGEHNFYLIETENLHPKSVRIGSNDTEGSAYIYTYGQTDQRYGLHLEYPFIKEANISEQEEIYDDMDYKALLEALKAHFNWLN